MTTDEKRKALLIDGTKFIVKTANEFGKTIYKLKRFAPINENPNPVCITLAVVLLKMQIHSHLI